MVREPINEIPRHTDAIMYVNNLIIDLKLAEAGLKPTRPITEDRLNEWREIHGPALERCQKWVGLRH